MLALSETKCKDRGVCEFGVISGSLGKRSCGVIIESSVGSYRYRVEGGLL